MAKSKNCCEFENPVKPDKGRCAAPPFKRDCETPVLPVIECDDDEYTLEPSGNPERPFNVISRIFDHDCLPILDENDEPILGVSN